MMPLVIWWVVYAVVAVVLMVAAYLLTPSQKKPKEQNQNIEIPIVKEGKNIPILYGTDLLKDLSIVNYFDLKIVTEAKENGKKQ